MGAGDRWGRGLGGNNGAVEGIGGAVGIVRGGVMGAGEVQWVPGAAFAGVRGVRQTWTM